MRVGKIAAISIGLMAVISCSSVDKTTNISTNSNNRVSNKETKKSLEFSRPTDFDVQRGLKINRDNGSENYLEGLNASNFKYTGGYIYEGEVLREGIYISPEIEVEGVYAKNPTIEVSKDDTRYKEVEGKIKVEVKGDKKEVTFLDKDGVYVKLRDKNGNTKDILLNQEVEVKELPIPSGEVRYSKLKEGRDNGRVSYSVLTYEDGLEDAKLNEDGEEESINYNTYYGYDKYKDLDDIAGKKNVEVRTSVVGNSQVSRLDVDFGERLSDYKGRYEDILIDLDKSTLKFSEDGSSVTGGFNPDIVDKLTRYEKSKNPEAKLEFVTEIEDGDKKSVGKHNVVRKIIKDGVEVYSKNYGIM